VFAFKVTPQLVLYGLLIAVAVGLLGGAFPAARPSGNFFQRCKIVGVILVAIIALEAGTLATVFAGIKFGLVAFVGALVVAGVVTLLGLLLTHVLLTSRLRGGFHSVWPKLLITIVLLAILVPAWPRDWMGQLKAPMYVLFALLAYYIGLALYVTWTRSLTDLESDPMLTSLRAA